MEKQGKTGEEWLQQVRHLEQRLRTAEATIESLRRGEAGLRPDLAECRGDLDHHQPLMQELGTANEELQLQAEELRQQTEDLQAQAEELEMQNEELERLTLDLEAERALLRTVLEQMPDGVIVAEAPSGRFLLVNRQMENILGHRVPMAESLDQYATYQGFHPEGLPYGPADYPLAHCLTAGKEIVEEIKIIRGDGSPGVIQVSTAPVRDPQGQMIAGVGIYQDITERHRAEKEIQRQASFPQLNPNPVLEVDTAGRIIYCNQAAREAADALGPPAHISDFLPDDLHDILSAVKQTGQQHFRREVQIKDAFFLVSVSYAERFDTVRLYAIDITLLKQAEEASHQANQRSIDILESISDGFFSLDREMVVTHFNSAAGKLLGRDPNEVLGRKLFDAFPEARGSIFEEKYTEALREGKFISLETYFEPEPYRNWYDVRGYPFEDGISVYFQVTTERKKAQEAIIRAKEDWERTFDAVPDLIAILDTDHHLLRVNRAMAQALGMETQDLIGKHCYEYMHGTTCPVDSCPHQQLLQDGREHVAEIQVLNRDFLVTTSPILGEQGLFTGSVHVAHDITERKRAEEALKQAHGRLEQRVAERTAELRQTVAQLQEEVAERLAAEGALKSERQRFYDVLEMLPAYLVLLNPDYRVPFANRYFVERFGDSQGKRCFEYLFGRTEPCEICETFKVFKTGAPQRWEWTGPDGRNYDIYDYPFTDSDGSPLIMEMGIDITERKAAEGQAVSIGRLYRLLSKVNETIVRASDQQTLFREACRIAVEDGGFRLAWVGLVDPDGGAVRATAQYGFDEGYLANLVIPLSEVPESEGPTGVAVREGRYDVCNDFTSEPRMAPWREQAMARGYRSSAAFPLRVKGKIVGALSLYADRPKFFTEEEITLLESLAGDLSFALESMDREAGRRQAEEEVRRLNEGLERRVKERTAQLEAANRELEAFSYSVSHDLKAPLRAIDGFSRMLMLEHAAKLDAEALRLLDVIRHNTGFMAKLIEDLLALSRLGRHEVKRARIDLATMSATTFNELMAQTTERHPDLIIKDLPPAFGDHSLLNQVMMNLLANACKYTKFEANPTIEVGGWCAGDENIYYVKDNGVGFDMRFQNKLFGVFQRLHGSQDFEGTGVGLAIVQRILQRHGGRVWAEGKVGEGAIFFFALPATEA